MKYNKREMAPNYVEYTATSTTFYSGNVFTYQLDNTKYSYQESVWNPYSRYVYFISFALNTCYDDIQRNNPQSN